MKLATGPRNMSLKRENHQQHLLYSMPDINKQKEDVVGRENNIIEIRKSYINWNMKRISKRDTSALKDLRKDLKKLLIHQLHKQVLNASRQVRNNFQVPNTLTNTQNFMNRFLNDKQISHTDHTGMRGHNLGTSIAKINNVQKTLLKTSNSVQVPNRNTILNLPIRKVQEDRQYQQQPFISSQSNKFAHVEKSPNYKKTGRSPVKLDQSLSHNWYTSSAITQSPTTFDHRTTLTRHYNVVHSTKRKHLPEPTYIQPFTAPTMPKQIPNVNPIAAAATVLQQKREEHFHEPSTKELPGQIQSSKTDTPYIDNKHGSTLQSVITLTTVSPSILQRPTKTLQVSPTIQTPTQAPYAHTHYGSGNVVKTGNDVNYVKSITSPKTIISKTGKELKPTQVREPTMDSVTETKDNTSRNDSTKQHLSKLINLQGIHILFTNNKPDHTTISKHPTLHLSASIEKPANNKSKASSQNDRTAHVKSSNGDVHFSSFSKNKYVGTAMMRNGHLFLVIYPPDKTIRHSTIPEKSRDKMNKLSTNTHDSHDNKTEKGEAYQVNPTSSASKLGSKGEISTLKHDSNFHSLLAPAITNSILSSLKARVTEASNLAYEHGTATVKLQTSLREPLSKNNWRTEKDTVNENRTHPIATSRTLQEKNGENTNIHNTHRDQSEHARHKLKEHIPKHYMTAHSSGVIIKENKKGQVPFENSVNNTSNHKRLHSDHVAHEQLKPEKMFHEVLPKATDPFMNIHGTHTGSHKMHGEATSQRSTSTDANSIHGVRSAERFRSPWKNVDLSSVLPSFPRVKKHKVDQSDDDSNPDVKVYSFVAKATDPFDKIQRILDNLQSSKTSTNDSNSSEETSFNFELTLNSDSTNADNAANSDDDHKDSGSQNNTADNLLELLSSTIHKAAKAYDTDFTKDRIIQRMSDFGKLESTNSTGNDKLMDHIFHDFTKNESKTQSLNEKYVTNVVTKHSTMGDRKTVSIKPNTSRTTTIGEKLPYPINQITTKENHLPFLEAQGINPTEEPTNLKRDSNGNSEIINAGSTTSNELSINKLNELQDNTNNKSSNQVPALPTDIMQILKQSNKSESQRKDYIRNQIVHDIVHTNPTAPPTINPAVMDIGQFHNHISQNNDPVLQEFKETRQSFSGRKKVTRENELFLKSQASKTESHHEMPLSKALYLIKQQTNDLRSKKAIEKQLTKTYNNNAQSNSEFNAMLILSIDDILADHTNLHGALVVSFLTENTRGQSTT